MSNLLLPGSDEWRRTLSPSKGATILGVSRFDSPYALWHRTKGLVAPEPDKDIFAVGHAFEPALAYLWKEANPGWNLSPGEVQVQRDYDGVPALATIDRRASRGSFRRVVEFKTARKLEEWGDDFTDQAPADYVCQVTMQMHMTGYREHPAHLMVMGPFFQSHIYEIAYNPALADAIMAGCINFWRSLEQDTPPDLDDTKATYSCVRELHPDIDGTEVQLDPELAIGYLTAVADEKEVTARLRGYKSRVLAAMRNAQQANCFDQKVATRGPHGRGGIALKSNSKANIADIEGLTAA